MVRDGSGRVQVVSPLVAADVANKAYVDAATNSGNHKVVFSTIGTTVWTVPDNVEWVDVIMISAGYPGDGAYRNDATPALYAGNGGGGGALAYLKKVRVTPGSTVSVIIPAGGTAATGLSNSGLVIPSPVFFGNFSLPSAISRQGALSGSTFPFTYILGDQFVCPGMWGSIPSATIGGGGGAAASITIVDSSNPLVAIPIKIFPGATGAAPGTTGPIAGRPDLFTGPLGAGSGGGSYTATTGAGTQNLPGVGGGGAGATTTGLSDLQFLSGQNGGRGEVVIMW